MAKTEKDKMMCGDWFNYMDPELKEQRIRCNKLIFTLNQLDNSEKSKRMNIVKELFGHVGDNANIKSSFQCDYGCNIFIGENVFTNYDCVFVDAGTIEIGDHTLIGPQVGIYTVNHPFDPTIRRTPIEKAESVKIGKNCWIGGHVTINPGVTLGDNVIVASGAVVTNSFKSNVMIAGVPARVIKKL